VCVKLSIRFFFVLLEGWARATLSLFIIVLCSAVSVLLCVCVNYNKASWASLGCATQQPRRTRVYLLCETKQKKAALITLSSSIHLRNVYRASMASSSELLLFIVPLSKPFFGSRYIVSSRIFLDQTASQKGEKYYLFFFSYCCAYDELQRHDM
jgi:hypothetical protein